MCRSTDPNQSLGGDDELTKLTLVVPVFNEAGLIRESAAVFRDFLDRTEPKSELIFSDDGSTDGTLEILREIAAQDDSGRTHLVGGEVNQGKGAALNIGLAEAKGNIVSYIDADLEIDVKYLGDVLEGIREGFDLCVGSKYIGDSKRESRRKIAHLGYNGMVRVLLGSRVHDHSCGVKAFRKEVVRDVLPSMKDKKWVWDTEFLVRAQKAGYRVKEIPIHSISRRDSKVKFVEAVLQSFGAVLKLFLRGVRVPSRKQKLATTPREPASESTSSSA